MGTRRVWLSKSDVVRLSLPLNHNIVKRGLYLGCGKASIYAILNGNGPMTVDELIELSDEMGYQYWNTELIYESSPDI